jgi:hypothetical protein
MAIEEYLEELHRYHDRIGKCDSISYQDMIRVCRNVNKMINSISIKYGIQNTLHVAKRRSINDIFHDNFKYIKLGD